MKIYTKTGDKGETSFSGGKRVSKCHLRIEAYGTVDELNSVVGICRSINTVKDIDTILEGVQNDLFTLGADLADPQNNISTKTVRILPDAVTILEAQIDKVQNELKPLRNFIIPGGTREAATLHYARTVCRRAERTLVRLSHDEPVNENGIIYLNRLSDLLFVLARWSNALTQTSEVKWHK